MTPPGDSDSAVGRKLGAYRIEEFIKPEKIDPEIEKEWGEFKQYAYPLSPGGALVISDFQTHGDELEMETGILNLETIAKGLKIMAEEYPRQYKDMVQETDDADTGDCLLQCCIFGEVQFG